MAALGCALLMAACLAGCGADERISEPAAQSQPIRWDQRADDLQAQTLALKSSWKDMLAAAAEDDIPGAKAQWEKIARKNGALRASIGETLEQLGQETSDLQRQLRDMQLVLEWMELAGQLVVSPLLEELLVHPLAQVYVEGGFDTARICGYLTLLEDKMPQLAAAAESRPETEGDLWPAAAGRLLAQYRQEPELFARLRALLRDGRTYLLAVQNTAEPRACGGFPALMSKVRIHNGVLYLGDFQKPEALLIPNVPGAANVTVEETKLSRGTMNISWNAVYCPDFPRVAGIWALCDREAQQGEKVDGVISVTPDIVQRVLDAAGERIKLFNGFLMEPDTAMQVLQHDLYYRYFGAVYVGNRDIISGQLFSDAVKKTVRTVQENMTPRDILGYLDAAEAARRDRTLMLWMADAEEQAFLTRMGLDGGLNADPQNPQAGVYFNGTLSGKMGWYLKMDTEMGSGQRNADGSYTYPVTVTFADTLTAEELKDSSQYITGVNGAITGCAYFAAPAGGTVSDFSVSRGNAVESAQYGELALGFLREMTIKPDSPLTVHYRITTAPGVETVPTFSKTPTIQEILRR